jgi:hypothetical protein
MAEFHRINVLTTRAARCLNESARSFLNEEPIMRTFIADDSADIFLQDWGSDGGGKNSGCSYPDSRTSSTALRCPLRAKLTASRLVSTSSPCSRRRRASASPLAEATPDLRKHGKTRMDGFSHLFELVLLHGRCRAICRPQIPSVAVDMPIACWRLYLLHRHQLLSTRCPFVLSQV